ncbi:MAG: hypothetical protein AAGM22_33235, partial [Acidobacteriota bacterium]
IPTYGPSWAWVLGAAAPFESDGLSLDAILRWAAAEGGFELDVDPALLLDGAGEPVRVRGSVASLPLEAALSAVLESADLDYSLDDGRLRVFAVDAAE